MQETVEGKRWGDTHDGRDIARGAFLMGFFFMAIVAGLAAGWVALFATLAFGCFVVGGAAMRGVL